MPVAVHRGFGIRCYPRDFRLALQLAIPQATDDHPQEEQPLPQDGARGAGGRRLHETELHLPAPHGVDALELPRHSAAPPGQVTRGHSPGICGPEVGSSPVELASSRGDPGRPGSCGFEAPAIPGGVCSRAGRTPKTVASRPVGLSCPCPSGRVPATPVALRRRRQGSSSREDMSRHGDKREGSRSPTSFT